MKQPSKNAMLWWPDLSTTTDIAAFVLVLRRWQRWAHPGAAVLDTCRQAHEA
jgi:hypothetical protein